MNPVESNKKLVLEFVRSISGRKKTKQRLLKYTSDPDLVEHFIFYDTVFPFFRIDVEELTAEDDRVFMRATLSGIHRGNMAGAPPTFKEIRLTYALGYVIEDGMITDHWMITDHMDLLKQMGLMENGIEESNSII